MDQYANTDSANLLTAARNYDGTGDRIGYEPVSRYDPNVFPSGKDISQLCRVTSLESGKLDTDYAVTAAGGKSVMAYANSIS